MPDRFQTLAVTRDLVNGFTVAGRWITDPQAYSEEHVVAEQAAEQAVHEAAVERWEQDLAKVEQLATVERAEPLQRRQGNALTVTYGNLMGHGTDEKGARAKLYAR